MTTIEAGELICECGINFRCPRCNARPVLLIAGLELKFPDNSTREVEFTPKGGIRPPPNRSPEHWVGTEEAAAMIGVSLAAFRAYSKRLGSAVRRERVSKAFAYYIPDLEEIARLRKEADLGADAAIRVYATMIARGLYG